MTDEQKELMDCFKEELSKVLAVLAAADGNVLP